MTKQELVDKVKELLAKNKTEEALKLLSTAQLSENDKTVILLMGQMTKLQHDDLINKVTNEERNRAQASINESILNLAEKISPDEVGLEKEKKVVPNEVISIIPPSSSVSSKTPLEKYKFHVIAAAVVLLGGILILMNRMPAPAPREITYSSPPPSTEQNKVSDKEFLAKIPTIWNSSNVVYSEDFSAKDNSNFRGDIWNENSTSKDYSTKVDVDNKRYEFNIKKKGFSRHKYLGRLPYNAQNDIIPYSVRLFISSKSNCTSTDKCLGRGLTIRYNNKKKSTYSFTLNDSGNLLFKRLYSFEEPSGGKILFSKKFSSKKDKYHNLGVICKEDTFYLFYNEKLIQTINDPTGENGKFCGVIASGVGLHLFDEVILKRH